MIRNFFYDGQIRSYLVQFCSIFYGLQVQTGIGECDVPEFISVPTVVGSKDRVVAAVMSGNTQNRMFSLPAMAANITAISLAPERRKGFGIVDQRVTLKKGGVFPADLTTVKRAVPVPYNMTVELSIYASNSQQMHQILEQILVLFNPDLQIQRTDAAFDWTRITRVELTDIANEENYPSGTERRMIVWTLTFEIPIYLSIPMGVKDDLVRKVIVRISDLSGSNLNEVDQDGHLKPFGETLATVIFDTTSPTPETATFNQTTLPTDPSIANTWYNPDTGVMRQFDGTSWKVFETYLPPSQGGTESEDA